MKMIYKKNTQYKAQKQNIDEHSISQRLLAIEANLLETKGIEMEDLESKVHSIKASGKEVLRRIAEDAACWAESNMFLGGCEACQACNFFTSMR